MTEAPGRTFARYSSDDDGPVSLPGYLGANPGIVVPGDVFGFDDAYASELGDDPAGRFEILADVTSVSPNQSLTKAQLAEKLNADANGDDVDPAAYSKADLVAMADDYDRTHPAPPGDAFDGDTATDTEGTPA